MVKSSERDAFIEKNIPLVHSLCKRFVGRGIEYDDLYGAGCVGLVKAADNFDFERGLQFSTYAVPVVLGEIRRLFRDGGAVKVSRSLKELSLKVTRLKATLELQLGREPSVCELAEKLCVSPEDITEALCASQPTVSLTCENDDGVYEFDLPTPNTEDLLADKLVLEKAFKCLSEREIQIVRYRYYEYLTQSETASRLCMSQVQVSRAEKKILTKLRAAIGTVA